MHELPLVFFTVLTQSAVGALILLLLSHALGQIEPRRLAIGLFAAVCLFGLGVLVGIFHVGQPLRAMNMLLRVGLSPMSNEIALSAMFGAAAGIAALGLLLDRDARKFFTALAWLAAVIGVVFIFAIPRIYQLPTVATWSASWTTVIMLLTPLIGGGALAAALGARRLGLVVSIVGIIVSFCLRPGYLSSLLLADAPLAAAQSGWFTAQAVLLAAGALGALLYIRTRHGQGLLYASAGVVIVAELLGRIAFYNLWTLPM
ncbi:MULTISPECIES: dimethyl sulfoxide reductase anchor subunit family protein [Tenebrionibacter/Tenebrionicola group]|jgi:anaerobic dimethyl sulfoxide reductase subunit C (anchor subunit)|uniref:Dimethyl sulfoxide reductase anchor subunit n=2 Tax=Tenebrionibacter/Tenebrionicola group TaxID=2969848 RepID=A0A8K0Y0N5_9ENTR|nr:MULTISPECIES: DmsC/YnfH family molybdoenzyme membrane anchor subunit [Tenebrionibacter/Tenebrionicola group]MBK4716809.1 dimethyl sulfoxide reductase anchor subunit [Tenebrionibacter intestinalis]MBV5097346.1 dimethyl sulfoxide reductase anchor subunit [Tenebrionicola larvae]